MKNDFLLPSLEETDLHSQFSKAVMGDEVVVECAEARFHCMVIDVFRHSKSSSVLLPVVHRVLVSSGEVAADWWPGVGINAAVMRVSPSSNHRVRAGSAKPLSFIS
jgi:hypothetical protein